MTCGVLERRLERLKRQTPERWPDLFIDLERRRRNPRLRPRMIPESEVNVAGRQA